MDAVRDLSGVIKTALGITLIYTTKNQWDSTALRVLTNTGPHFPKADANLKEPISNGSLKTEALGK